MLIKEKIDLQPKVEDIKKRHIYFSYLKSLSNGQAKAKECHTQIAEDIGITFNELKASPVYARCAYASLDCEWAGYIERVSRGIHQLTETGEKVYEVLAKFEKHDMLHTTLEIIDQIDGRYPTPERGLQVLSELQDLARKILPRVTSPKDVLMKKIAVMELQLEELKQMVQDEVM